MKKKIHISIKNKKYTFFTENEKCKAKQMTKKKPLYFNDCVFGLDIDVIELNEAFAAQVLACTRSWGLTDDDPRLNPNGGAIAIVVGGGALGGVVGIFVKEGTVTADADGNPETDGPMEFRLGLRMES